jgi:NAD(P)-dependent dehydrogenase (short-subunit alcohol dehydrogenase family)
VGALDGKVAIVTGAGRGIGRAEALLLASEGASVVVNELDAGLGQAVVDEITAAGGRAEANEDSVAEWKGAERLVAQAVDSFGDLHVLVNNAGILRDKMSFNMDEDDWDAVVAVHLKGHFAPSRFAAAYWRDQAKAGREAPRRIINTSSEAGLFGSAGQANYAAAKGGIYSLTLVLARELQRYGVTVNAIAPRAATRMTETIMPEEMLKELPPEGVASLVGWLASDAAADVSGQVFIVMGGRVHLLQGLTVVGELRKAEGSWTIEELTAQRDALFGDRPSGVPSFGLSE